MKTLIKSIGMSVFKPSQIKFFIERIDFGHIISNINTLPFSIPNSDQLTPYRCDIKGMSIQHFLPS